MYMLLKVINYIFRCVWQDESVHSPGPEAITNVLVIPPIEEEKELSSPAVKSLPRIRMPAEIVSKLRELSGRHPPQTRPSIRLVY